MVFDNQCSMRKVLGIFLVVFFCAKTHAQQSIILDSTILDFTVVADSNVTNAPWSLNWGFDNRLWFSDLKKIRVWNPTTGQLRTLFSKSYGNFLGIAVPKSLTGAGPTYVYAVFDTGKYYGYGSSRLCHLYRFVYNPTLDTLTSDSLIFSYNHNGEHSGGKVIITSDNKLMVTSADYFHVNDSLGYRYGKVLRLNTDGTAPIDNARPDYTWSYGHRNPQGMIALSDGKVFVTEHEYASRGEINLVKKGKHYGWPVFDGYNCFGPFQDSCISLTYLANYEAPRAEINFPPAGLDYYNHPSIPEWKHSLLIGTLGSANNIVALRLSSANDSILSKKDYPNTFKRIRDICTAPDGSVYLIAYDRLNVPNTANTEYNSQAVIYRLRNPFYTNGIQTENNKIDFGIYPNPATSHLDISLASAASGIYTISDLSGKVMKSDSLSGRDNRIDITTLLPGYYLINIKGREHFHVEKPFVIIR